VWIKPVADGKELYFIALDGELMATSITSSEKTVVAGTPVALFPTRLVPVGTRQQYVVSHDGRFLLDEFVDTASNTPITLILNWHPKDFK
jgi:hypothetical protein